ncbi:type VII secretion integral membrane protein EccD [Micromonospora sp. Llam0]|uniref:type VII secretion integral membrane protein EccD n=1 Tax=Micromonospora sp. Llam0 TaxID=2485143 RepID=UPI000F47BDB0|nr:type VII secretion integral membrane protein EccD [Micromonospora sp. Llam0]ROO63205.1 type VII secretion integral membrane protein EccD [Micromonospora sp. Llam0]
MEPLTRQRLAAPVRLRFVLGNRTADLALPGETPLVDLLPEVLLQLDPDAADRGAEHDGWVLQRLGRAPLDEERTAVELQLLDGETLHFRPRAEQLPPIDFDDLVDGVADQSRTSPYRWSVPRTRAMLLTMGALALAGGLLVLGLDGPVGARAAVAALLALPLLAAAGLVSRAVPDPQTGTLLTGGAAAYAAMAGWLGAEAIAPYSSTAVRVAVACLALLVTLAAGASLVAAGALVFTGAIAFVATGAVTALLAAVGPVTPQEAAACGLVLTLLIALMLPPLGFRLGGLALPLLPGRPEQLSEDIEPAPYRMVVDRGSAGLAYHAALTVGMGAAQTISAAVLVAPGGLWPMMLALVIAALISMRSRHMSGLVTRWATLTPAIALVLFDLLRFAADRSDLTRAVVLAPAVVVIAGAILTAGGTLPGRRLRPYWGRTVDILEIVIAVALIPVLGAVLGIYPMIRAWAS